MPRSSALHRHSPTYAAGAELDSSPILSVRAGKRLGEGRAQGPVSLLILRAASGEALRFFEMATTLAALPSPAAAPCLCIVAHAGRPAVVTTALEGSLLSTRLSEPAQRARAVPTERVRRSVADVAELTERVRASQGGRSLGGIEPGAVWLCPDGLLLLLPNAGCARPGRHRAPELAAGAAPDASSDVYSLGLLLWDLLALGRAGLPEASCAPTSHGGAGLDRGVIRLVMACLDPDPALRPSSPGVLATSLRALGGPASVTGVAAPRIEPAAQPTMAIVAPPFPSPACDDDGAALVVVEGPASGLRLRLPRGADRLRVGRSLTTDLPVPDPEMSRRHFEVVRGADGGYRAFDLGSKNGLLVRGAPACGHALQQGDVLVAGATHLRFETARPVPSLPVCSRSLRGGSS